MDESLEPASEVLLPNGQPRSPFATVKAALTAVARRPTRATFATWARAIETRWLLPLILVDFCLILGTDILSAIAQIFSQVQTTHAVVSAQAIAARWVHALVVAPLAWTIWNASLIIGLAALSPEMKGILEQRVIRITKPFLLMAIVTDIMKFVINALSLPFQITSLAHISALGVIPGLLGFAGGIYYIIALLNALAAATRLPRWLLFIVVLLAFVLISLPTTFVISLILKDAGVPVS